MPKKKQPARKGGHRETAKDSHRECDVASVEEFLFGRECRPAIAIAPGKGTTLPASLTKDNLMTRREEFFAENADLLNAYEGFSVKARMDMTGAMRLSVLFPLKVSQRQLNEAWKHCLGVWAARLEAFNEKTRGGNPLADWPEALLRWRDCKSRGDRFQGSYADLADEVNGAIMADLHAACYCADEFDAEEMKLREDPDPQGAEHLRHARVTMTLLNVKPQKQDEWIAKARARRQKRQSAFATKTTSTHGRTLSVPRLDGPVTPTAVKGFLQANSPK